MTTQSLTDSAGFDKSNEAYQWGVEDALIGCSWAEGFGLFAGERLAQYLAGWKAGQALAERLRAKVLAEVAATMPGAPQDLVEGVADMEMGATYCAPGIDWGAVEDSYIGD